jgi:hypothetical protein
MSDEPKAEQNDEEHDDDIDLEPTDSEQVKGGAVGGPIQPPNPLYTNPLGRKPGYEGPP